ncbi:MAG TPA: hypothetical protein VF017_03880 [Thermoanaerobaculia bacterium]|nr:hypothetical protein [Thermoanaerobaculia bacterium]
MSDRKYRQRGYQSEEPRERPSSTPRPPGERKEGPRGRGLGAPTSQTFRCAACGARLDPPAPDAFAATCQKCRTDLHTCSHCTFFDTSAPKECRQPIEERVAKKTKANHCSFFQPRVAVEFARDQDAPATPTDARSAFDALFKL